MTEPEFDLAEVDALVRQGRVDQAADLLERLLQNGSDNAVLWLQLAGLRRALRQPRRALDAVHRALAIAPLDFVGLVMRASLLERLDPQAAGKAWHEALAQKPDVDLPPPLAATVARGQELHAAWSKAREERLTQASGQPPLSDQASPAQDADRDWRIARFRSNILRKTRVFHSEPTHFHYPGLPEREFHPPHRFPWLERFAAATDTIRAEALALLHSGRAELIPYLQYGEHEALAQWRTLNNNPDWGAIHLVKDGARIDVNADACPVTMKLLSHVAQPHIAGASPNALFSLLAPHTAIPPHVGVNNTRLLCHVPVDIPPGCWFRVGAETRFWEAGKPFVFDDTIEHEAENPSDKLRIVLIFDLWHPDLDATERDAVARIISAEGAEGAL